MRLTYGRLGYLQLVENLQGKKAPVYIAQTIARKGFSAINKKTGHFIKSSMNAEKLAVELAHKGHKTVEFRD